MKFYRIATLFLSIYSIQGYSQKVDTIAWDDVSGRIKYTFNDSTFKTVRYWKGNISSIKYTGLINGCLTSIKSDTLFDIEKVRKITHYKIHQLSNSKDCDSLVLIKSVDLYNNEKLATTLKFKQVDDLADCPCGRWTYYNEKGEIDNYKDFESCYNIKLNNLDFIESVWSPDRNYYLELYKEKMMFAMPGQGSDHMATIILKTKNGTVLQYISSNATESIMYRDIKIEWNMDKKKVWYGVARIFKF
jgi:hypothetical protein